MKKFFKEWILPIGFVFIVALLIQKFLFFHVVVPTGSMEPTIGIGDRMLVLHVYDKEKLNRGDVVVFKVHLPGRDELYVKRLIGKPGDHIDIVDGEVSVNGKVIDEPYVINEDNFNGSYDVPLGKYFFLGDNRPNSGDSRFPQLGFVDEADIEAKAGLRFWPLDRMGFLDGGESNLKK